MKRYVFVFVLCLCGSWTSRAQNQPTLLPGAPEAQEAQSQEPGASSTAPATPAIAQQSAAPKMQRGTIAGNVTDTNNDPIPGAAVELLGPTSADRRNVVTDANGFFQFNDLKPGIRYRVTVNADNFSKWTSPLVTLNPGQRFILTGAQLHVAQVVTTVTVASSPASLPEIAAEQLKIEEKQRVFGIIPNFYVVYDHYAVPLTPKLKFKLALRTSIDPVTIAGVALFAGIYQAADYPDYVQGAKGYGERFGAIAADGFIDIMIGGAILPSLLHQDPRYFYQGTGTKKSRALHALSYAFVCKGDNGRLQPNYSTIGGDLATAAISTTYYPSSNRGVGQVFESFLIGTG